MLRSVAVSAALVSAVAMSGAAAAAVEVTFLQSAQITASKIVTYTPGPVSSLSIAAGSPALAVGLDMLKPAFGPATYVFMPVSMSMWATTTDLVTFTGLQYEQGGFDGTIAYSWWDPVSSTTLNLLTVTFENAKLNVDLGGTPSGSFFGTHPDQFVSYTSDVFDVGSVFEADFSLAFSSVSRAFDPKSGVGTEFSANVVGTYAAAVPEPATWAMLITGFGLVGFAARRRNAALSVRSA